MQIKELFRRLSFGELSNLSMSGEGTGVIRPESQEKLIVYTNDALKQIFGRFILLEKQLTLVPVAQLYRYPLLKKYSQFGQADTDTEVPFIIDTEADPFTEDVIKVLEVYDQHARPVGLNDDQARVSVFTPSPGVIVLPRVVPEDRPLNKLALVYQARHPNLLPTDTEQEIELPEILEKALQSYVAYQVYSHMNGEQTTVKAAEYLATYESQCQEIIDKDLVSTSYSATNSRFNRNGWV